MTRIRPPPFLPPTLLKLIPSLAPTRLSQLPNPPHLFEIIQRRGHKHVRGKLVAQRRRLVKTGTSDLFYRITDVGFAMESLAAVEAQVLYKGYPVYKKHQWLPARYILDHTWDFVSSRGKIFKGSDFQQERDNALKEPGVEEMLKNLAPAPDIGYERARQPVIRARNPPVEPTGAPPE